MVEPTRLARKPEARTEKVEDLVRRMLTGIVRVPSFQRGLKWEAKHVLELFDSIHRGYPVGSLLFYKRPAPAGPLSIGPISVAAEEEAEAWWVVDGQQRLTALAASLAREPTLPTRRDRSDPWVVYFDPENERFEQPPTRGEPPSTWVPLPVLLDASKLSEWAFQWQHRENEALRRAVFEAGTRIRDYPIPMYLIEAQRDVATEIFSRVNTSGKPLTWTEVHDALFGNATASPSTLDELAEDLRAVGMGRLDEDRLLTALVAMRGADPTQTIVEHKRRDPAFLGGAVAEALPILRRVLSFVRKDLGVPHLRLLPKSAVLDVLTRFLAIHAEPNPRTRLLLARWYWRAVLGAAIVNDRTLRRRGINAVTDDAEASVQRLLGLVRNERPRAAELPERFDPRADHSRLVLLAMARLAPRDLRSGERIDLPALLEAYDKDTFVPLVADTEIGLRHGAANRFLHEPIPLLTLLRTPMTLPSLDDAVLESHALDASLARETGFADDALDSILDRRAAKLTEALEQFAERVAAWGQNDRPSVDYLLEQAAEA